MNTKHEIHYPEGLKWTKQRKDVYEVLWQAKEPLSVVQIFKRLDKEKEEKMYAVSTIYRILSFFEEHELVNKSTWLGEDTVVYELNRGEHTHYAVCLQCHKRIPLSHCPFAHLHPEQLEGNTDEFTITAHKLELYGFCKDCKQQS